MNDKPRLIEVAFPLKQASLDSVHEKNVRHGHISTLHIWPARRPLAACRAALIATLLPDPGNKEERDKILEKLGGRVVRVVKKKKLPSGRVEEKIVEETVGGILHWKRESSPELEWFRREIRKAYGGRAPKVLDPFAGGGAIPLEAMRLGCEATASDINPVAWFILKCTLEYPQKLAGQHRPLPKFALESPGFMQSFFKATQKLTKKQLERNLQAAQLDMFPAPDVDVAWHLRAWGWWVLQRAKEDLERFYPVVNGKPTVAYLWARTVKCKNCRATIPLLKTRWLSKKTNRRVLLTTELNISKTGVVFGVQADVPLVGGNAAQRREHDRRIGGGTMSRSGATCPCCDAIMTMEDIRLEGRAGRLGTVMTSVVVDGANGKEYRLPTNEEVVLASEAQNEIGEVFAEIPFGPLEEPIPKGGSGAARAFSVDGYGLDKWYKLFTPRQLLALGTFVKHTRAARKALVDEGYPQEWVEAHVGYLAIAVNRLADRQSTVCTWDQSYTKVNHTFHRYALPITWDFCEGNPLSNTTGNYGAAVDWIAKYIEHGMDCVATAAPPSILQVSATKVTSREKYDVVVTDPPYYDAIPYADLMDFFYVWFRRTLQGSLPSIDATFCGQLAPKWDHERNDGEIIDDASRFDGDKEKSKRVYEDGMYRAFQASCSVLRPEGKFVIVFAHKQPDAWETLVSAIIRAGFVVDGSWPIATEMSTGLRNVGRASLSSSIWLVCKRRSETARPGWDNRVLDEMREKITTRLRDFWDAGIRGPDFVWAATGPALEAYSAHPVVKKANEPGQVMTVSEFLRHVRRIVVDFVVGRVLSGDGGSEAVSGLDDVTTYYLLHRNDFGMQDAPAGACILYAVSCGLSDRALADQFDILLRTGGLESQEADEELTGEESETGTSEGSGSKLKLKPWQRRKGKNMGYEAASGRLVPLIDQVHRLMHLWKAGEVIKVNDYLDARALRKNALFHQLLQSLIELAEAGSEERSLLESISNHLAGRGVAKTDQELLPGVQENLL